MYRNVTYKLIILGDAGVGKSSIIQRLVNDKYTEAENSTIGISYFRKNFTYKGQYINFDIWDTAGQEIYADLLNF